MCSEKEKREKRSGQAWGVRREGRMVKTKQKRRKEKKKEGNKEEEKLKQLKII